MSAAQEGQQQPSKPDWRQTITALVGIVSVLLVALGLLYTNAANRAQENLTEPWNREGAAKCPTLIPRHAHPFDDETAQNWSFCGGALRYESASIGRKYSAGLCADCN